MSASRAATPRPDRAILRPRGGSLADHADSGGLVPLDVEQAVVARLKSGDRAAFGELYAWYGDKLWRQVILPRLPIVELAEDVLKDSLRTALEKIDSFHYDGRSIFFWLRRIAVNKAMDAHRRHQRDQKLAEAVLADESARPQSEKAPDHGLDAADLARMVAVSLDLLNPRYAQALRLRLLEDRPREECAEILEVSVGTFDVLLHRATKAFRKVYPP